MHIVQVFVRVKPDCIDAFRAASLENARNSVKEPGIARFDVLLQQDDPTRFALVEVYRTLDDPPKHRETRHYQVWKETVEAMMAEPRSRTLYTNIYPDDAGWG
jgi:quinol monooxygenase YgiN